MRYSRLAFTMIAASFLIASCNEKTTTREEVEITTMDSTSRVLEMNTEKLEDQTKKVEASLEKLESEFEMNN
jgi:hypothetical protein